MNGLSFSAITLMVVFACVGFTACSDVTETESFKYKVEDNQARIDKFDDCSGGYLQA